MRPLEVDIWYTIVGMLPKKLIYICALWVLLHATGEKYPQSNVASLRALTAINRYADDFGIEK